MTRYLQLILLASVLLVYTRSNAQGGKWTLGFSGGAGLVSVRTTSLDYPKTFRGWNGGLSVSCEVNHRLSILANLFYEQKRYKENIEVTDYMGRSMGTAPLKDTYQYISLPLMASWSFGKRTKFVINTGGYINYLIRETLNMNAMLFGGPPNQSVNIDLTREPRIDAGAILGLGLSHPLTSITTLSVEFRNYAGLVDLSAKGSSKRFFMNYQALLVGLRFKLGKAA